MKPCVYLAGPITGLDYAGAVDWREAVTLQLADHKINGISPMRSKEYLKHIKEFQARGNDYNSLHIMSSAMGITTRDRFDATNCNMLLVNFLGATRVSIGTVMEIAWADAHRIPIICAMEPEGNPHDHAMVTSCIGMRTPTLQDTVDVIIATLRVYT